MTVGATAVVSDVTLGAGDDTLTATGLVLTDSDLTLEGGEGTDTFNATSGQIAALQSVGGATVSGFEALGVNGAATLDADVLGQVGFQAFNLDANAGAVNINELESGSNIVTLSDGADVTVDIAGDKDGDSDSVGVTVVDETTSTINVAADIETLNIVTSDSDDESGFDVADLTVTGADLESLVVSGDEAVTFDVSALASIDNVDVSGITSDSDASAVGAAGVAAPEYAAEITVGAGVTVTGSDGDDSITFGLNNEVTGGAGDDLFVVGNGAAATNFSTITDFQAGDVIEFDEAVASVESIDESDLGLAPGIDATFADFFTAATGGDDNVASSFEFAGNTYIALDGGTNDSLVELSGSVDLTGLTTEDATTQTVEIA